MLLFTTMVRITLKQERMYHKEFITVEQEAEILKLIERSPKIGIERNKVIRYGSRIPYSNSHSGLEVPAIFHTLNIPFHFDSVTINEYYEGQSIEYHYDSPGGGNKVGVLSLLGYADMNFKFQDDIQTYNLEPRSLFIMEDEYRWKYEHSATAKGLRYSIVFRNSSEFTPSTQPNFCNICKYYHTRGNHFSM